MELFLVAKILGPAEVRRRAQCLNETGQPAAP